MEGLLEGVGVFLIVYGPAMSANGSPVAVLRGRRGHPIDFGRRLWDGRRILGDGKTFEGLLVGMLAGIAAGVVVGLPLGILMGLDARVVLTTAAVSSAGALLGDLVKSFFKRRLGIERGASMPLADQLDFYLGATLAVYLCSTCVKPGWVVFALGALVVFVLHRATNIFAYRRGMKNVPW